MGEANEGNVKCSLGTWRRLHGVFFYSSVHTDAKTLWQIKAINVLFELRLTMALAYFLMVLMNMLLLINITLHKSLCYLNSSTLAGYLVPYNHSCLCKNPSFSHSCFTCMWLPRPSMGGAHSSSLVFTGKGLAVQSMAVKLVCDCAESLIFLTKAHD